MMLIHWWKISLIALLDVLGLSAEYSYRLRTLELRIYRQLWEISVHKYLVNTVPGIPGVKLFDWCQYLQWFNCFGNKSFLIFCFPLRTCKPFITVSLSWFSILYFEKLQQPVLSALGFQAFLLEWKHVGCLMSVSSGIWTRTCFNPYPAE